jgi:hypothetical protein
MNLDIASDVQRHKKPSDIQTIIPNHRPERETKKCLECAEPIRLRAKKCRFCGANQDTVKPIKNHKKCSQCGATCLHKRWIRHYNFPQFTILIGLLFFFFPGLIFWAWAYNKHKCTNCGAVGKDCNQDAS